MEGRELYAVAIDFADVEILSNFRYLGGWNVVCSAPDALSGLMLLRVRSYFKEAGQRMYMV